MSIIDTLKAVAITIRNEKKKEANTATRIGDLFVAIIDFIKGLAFGQIRQEGVDTYNDPSSEKTSLLSSYPNPETGWTVLVRNDETNEGKSNLYQWNGSKWINIETVIYNDDVATKDDLSLLDNLLEPFIVLDVIGCGTYSESRINYSQGSYYNNYGVLTPNSYWEYAELPIVPGTIYNLRGFSVGDGTVAPIILKEKTEIVKIFKNNINGVNVIFPANITSILISRAIGYNASIGVYDRYMDSNALAINNNKVSIFQDSDTHHFYRNALLDLKINGITGNEKIYLSTFYNNKNANQIDITDSVTNKILCYFYNDITESGIKEVYLTEYQNSGYSGYATINFDLLLNAILPLPLYPYFNNDVIRHDSKERQIVKRIDYFPYAKDIYINGFVPVGMIEGLSLYTLDDTAIPNGNFKFLNFKRTETSTQITINNDSTTVCNFWVGRKLTNTQTVKLTEFQNSKIEGYIRINFDLMDIGFSYANKAYYLDKNRIFNKQLFVDVLNNTSLLATGLVAKKNKTLLAIGDSFTAAREYQKIITQMLGMTVQTHAKGGAGIIQMIDGYGDLPPLSVTDVAGVDVITLYGGYNNRNVEHGQIGDIYPTNNTITGMIQYAINRIYELLKQANNMQCKIVIITPHCGGKYDWSDVDGYTEYPTGTGRTLEGMANAIKTIANYNSLPCIDLWHNSGINKFTWDTFQKSPVADYQQYIGRFATANELPRRANKGDRAKVDNYSGSYNYNGVEWNKDEAPYPWNADQLHCNTLGYAKLGECIARFINSI